MPEISRFYGIVIKIFYDDHNPPHFHAEYGEFEALFEIRTLKKISGQLPKRATRLVKKWAIQNEDELMEQWNKAKALEKPGKIKPLE